MKTYISLLVAGILLLAWPTFGQNAVLISSVALPGGGTGSGNVLAGPGNGYPSANNANDNVFVGRDAGFKITIGSVNAFMGPLAGYSITTGNFNAFTGGYAGRFNTTGSNNAFTGYLAGTNNTTGSYNSFFGYGADAEGVNKINLQRSMALGFHALVAVNDGLVLGDTTNVKVGIGTAYPNHRLTLRGNINFVAYDNSLRLMNQPFLHFNEHESLALGLGAEISPGAARTLVLGSKETDVQIPGVIKCYQPNAGQLLTVNAEGQMMLVQPRVQVASVADWSDKVFEPGYGL